jgi:cytochrome bd ubiquinol oxidase subunit I
MDVLEWARLQFGVTTVFHFLFVPVTIGLAPIIAVMHSAYVRTGNDRWRRMAQFFGKIFLINFAVGVVTGIVQEFQFGMNWSEYSRFVGDIFGAPLALEALLAFFLESTFLGVWIFGWDRLPPKLHLASIWLVAVGSTLSAYFILAANSFMQWPVGYVYNAERGRAELDSFWQVLTNPHLATQLPHTLLAAWATAGFVVLAISAWHLLRKRDVEVFLTSAKLALGISLVSSLLVAFVGHAQAQMMTQQQPMKMAAAEALWETEQPAGFSLFAIGDIEGGRNHINIQIPKALSLLSTNSLDGEVRGINDIQAEYEARFGPGDYRPNIGVAYWSFRLMVGAGMLMIAIAAVGLWLARRGRLVTSHWFLHVAVLAAALPFLANSTGWILTEMGRQPWLVFGVMTTEQGVSTAVGTASVVFSLVAYTLVYTVLAVVGFGLMARAVRAGPPEPADDQADADERVVVPVVAY